MKKNRVVIFFLCTILVAAVLMMPNSIAQDKVVASNHTSGLPAPYLVKNINPRTYGASPRCVPVGDAYAVCIGYVGETKDVLWRSDGTDAGTFLLKEFEDIDTLDIFNSATTNSGILYFVVRKGCCDYQTQVWQTNGTSAGTIEVAAIPEPYDLVTIGNTLYLLEGGDGFDTYGGLWKSDGTASGTEKFFAFTSSIHSGRRELALYDGELYFNNSSTGKGTEIWVSDGTTANTKLFVDINLGPDSSSPEHLTAAGNYLYFSADDGEHGRELWVSDGTVGGTKLVKDIYPDDLDSDPNYLTAANGMLFFTASYPHTSAIWRTMGTESSTIILIDRTGLNIAPIAADNLVYYPLDNSLVRSNGNLSGTFEVKNLEMSYDYYCPDQFRSRSAGSSLYFAYATAGEGCELWRSDGTPIGTKLVQDIIPGPQSSNPRPQAFVNNKLLMQALRFPTNDGSIEGYDSELWVSDGSPDGARLLLDMNRTPHSSNPSFFTSYDEKLFFIANDGTYGNEPWFSDGTDPGTQIAADVNPGESGIGTELLGSTKKGVVFSSTLAGNGLDLYVTDGTAVGTKIIKSLFSPGYAYMTGITEWKELAFFTIKVYPDETYEFWRTDGTNAGTIRLGEYFVQHMIPAENQLYFIKRIVPPGGGSYGRPAYVGVTDGTVGGTKQIGSSPQDGCDIGDNQLATLGDSLFYSWCDDEKDMELWYLSGPNGQPTRVADINPQESSNPIHLVPYNGSMYFSAYASDDPTLWVSDGTEPGTKMVSETPAYNPKPFSSGFFFTNEDLWVSDGTAAGTKKIADFASYSYSSLVVAEDHLFLSAQGTAADPAQIIWISDGTESGTNAVGIDDIYTSPRDLFSTGDHLFFTASDVTGDKELWALKLNFSVRADFTASPTSGAPPLTVNFSNLSKGDYDRCEWDFGDGRTKVSCGNPVVKFNEKGEYTISLTVSGPGGEDTKTLEKYIKVFDPIKADFSADPTSGGPDLLVEFTNKSSGDFDHCLWDFGDGRTKVSCGDPTVKFKEPGKYTISLTVTGYGEGDTKTEVDYIEVFGPPTADFTVSPAVGTLPLLATFTNQSTGQFDRCEWDFGDGRTKITCGSPIVKFKEEGKFTVSLKVIGIGGEDSKVIKSCVEVFSDYRVYLPNISG